MTIRVFLLAVLLLTNAGFAGAQSRGETLADIRQQLSFLHVEMQRLKQELSTTGGATGTGSGGTSLQRLDNLEGELRRITGKVEELEFRVDSVVRDGTNRIGDLEFRLVELEGGDVSTLGETSTLGGDTGTTPAVIAPPVSDNSELAVSEEVDFNAAMAAFDEGDYENSAILFGNFTSAYPGGPLTSEAHFWRGESQSGFGDWSNAARSYLQSFSSDPAHPIAPKALLRLGISLDRIGQPEEACLTLNEVGIRYPNADATTLARQEMNNLGCAN